VPHGYLGHGQGHQKTQEHPDNFEKNRPHTWLLAK
jgi:hypothetical protein